MAFLSSFDICASGTSAQRIRMDTAAEDVARIDTTRTKAGGPYRKKGVLLESFGTGSLREVMRDAAMKNEFASRHAGVRVSGIVEDDRRMKRVYNPRHPDADAEGYISMPDVDLLKETVDSASATRSYEASVTALGAMRLMAQKTSDIGK